MTTYHQGCFNIFGFQETPARRKIFEPELVNQIIQYNLHYYNWKVSKLLKFNPFKHGKF